MGSYKEIKGDLIALAKKGEFDMIAHGCNCYQTMGAGIAKQIKEHFPKAYKADQKDIREPLSRLGDLTFTYINESEMFILNLYTQLQLGKNLDYTALSLCLKKISLLSFVDESLKIGLPMIGCGIAGGDWNIVRNLIQVYLKEHDVTIVIYDPEAGI